MFPTQQASTISITYTFNNEDITHLVQESRNLIKTSGELIKSNDDLTKKFHSIKKDLTNFEISQRNSYNILRRRLGLPDSSAKYVFVKQNHIGFSNFYICIFDAYNYLNREEALQAASIWPTVCRSWNKVIDTTAFRKIQLRKIFPANFAQLNTINSFEVDWNHIYKMQTSIKGLQNRLKKINERQEEIEGESRAILQKMGICMATVSIISAGSVIAVGISSTSNIDVMDLNSYL